MELVRHYDLKPRILVIDTNSDSLRRVQASLSDQYDVHLASSVSLALILMKEYRYVLVLTSLDLPSRFNGLNIVRTIKTTPSCKSVRVVGVSMREPVEIDPEAQDELDGWIEGTEEPETVRSVVRRVMTRQVGLA